MSFCLPRGAGKQKAFRSHPGRLVAKGLRIMENRYLPILLNNILLRVLSLSNEPPSFRDEWAVKSFKKQTIYCSR
jgi:hypothetical protein